MSLIMDFDTDLLQIQGGIMRANHTHPFAEINSIQDNEVEIEKIVQIFHKLLIDKGYITKESFNKDKAEQLRRIVIFFILNCDAEALTSLANNDDIGHLVWVTPSITKSLLYSIVWGTNLEHFFCEAVQYTCPQLSSQLLKAAAHNLRHLTPLRSVQSATLLITAAYRAIVQMKKGIIPDDKNKIILDDLYNAICEMLKYFTDPPNRSKMNDWKKLRLYQHAGHGIYYLFKLLIDCLNVFLNQVQEKLPKELEIYNLINVNNENKKLLKNDYDDFFNKYFNRLNEMLLNAIEINLKAVNIDIYCSWCECEDIEDPNKTLQKSIGELAFALGNILLKDLRFCKREAVSMLLNISCRPPELAQIIEEADRETVLQNCKEDIKDRSVWISALIRKKFFFNDVESIDFVLINKPLLQNEDFSFIFKNVVTLFDEHSRNTQVVDKLKNLALESLSSLNTQNQAELIIDVYSQAKLNNSLELPNYDAKLTELLNKMMDINDENLTNLYGIFVQNVEKLYNGIIKNCLHNSRQTDVLIVALKHLKRFHQIEYKSNEFSEYSSVSLSNLPLLIFNLVVNIDIESLVSEQEKSAYIIFLKGIIENLILDDKVIILSYVMPAVHVNWETRNFSNLTVMMQAWKETFSSSKHSAYITPMLLTLAEIMNTIRWDLNTFSTMNVELLQITIDLQQSMMESFLESKTSSDKEYLWLQNKLSFISPINAYYYQKLWPEKSQKRFFDTRLQLEEAFTSLCYLLPQSTPEEWTMIFLCMSLESSSANALEDSFKIFTLMLQVLYRSAEKINSDNSMACFEYCCRNTAIIHQRMVLPSEKSPKNLIIVRYIADLINSLPEEIRLKCFMWFLNPVSYYVQRLSKGASDEEINELKNTIDLIHDERSKNILYKMLP